MKQEPSAYLITKIVNDLLSLGYTQAELAKLLAARGIAVTQPTICRISKGHADTSYTLGKGIEAVHAELVAERAA